MRTTPKEYREIIDALLIMLYESDFQDYTVLRTHDRTGTTVLFGINLQHAPLYRVTISGAETITAIRVSEGRNLKAMEPIRHVKEGDTEAKESVLRWLTEIIEDADDAGRNLESTATTPAV